MLKYNPKTFMSSLQKCKSAKPFFPLYFAAPKFGGFEKIFVSLQTET